MNELRTSPSLLEKLRASVGCEMSAENKLQQRISFIWGMLGHDSTITKEQILSVLTRN